MANNKATTGLSGPVRAPSLLDVVYERLRSAVQSGELHPESGKRLSLRDIAGRLGTSTTPVREALRRLEAEGLVTVGRGTGIRVHRLSAIEFAEITDMRVRLETLALERAFNHFTAAHVHRLDSMVTALDGANDTTVWRDLNQAFHEATYEPGDYPRVLRTVKTLWVVVDPYLRLYSERAHNLAAAQEEHRGLVSAIRGKDLQGALDGLEAHIRRAAVAVLDEAKSAVKLFVDD